MKSMIFLLILTALASCQKEPPIAPEPPPKTSKLEVLWAKPISVDTAVYTTMAQAIVKDGVVFTTNFYSSSAFARVLDAETGNLRWKFDDFISPIDGFLKGYAQNVNEKVVINDWSQTVCIDAASGNVDWSLYVGNQGFGEPTITNIGDFVYKANYSGSKPKTKSESIVRSHYLNGKWDTLLTITAADSFYLNIETPSLWINPQGDSVLIIRDNGLRDVHATPWEGRYNLANLYAWNMRTKEFEWSLPDFQDQRALATGQPIIDGNHLYIHSHRIVYCVNLLDGSIVWKKEFQDGIYFSNMVQHNNIIIIHGSDHGIWGLHKFNGGQMWYNGTTIGTVDNLNYFDGVVYFTSSGSPLLYAIDADNGNTIWAEPPPNRSSRTPGISFSYGEVAIDPMRRVLYTADKYFMMCIKLPEH